jgi:predicted aldo/keto reductase-like oxidoreductase
MHVYNNWKSFGLKGWAREELAQIPADKRADKCDDCAACEKKCPNELPVRTRLQELQKLG